MSETEARGRFVWYDLMTSDPDAAVDFYGKVIGWGTAPWEGGPLPYTMWTKGETPIGGVMEFPEDVKAAGVPPHWIAYIATPDVDATVARAKQLGGCVLHDSEDIPDVGRFAVLGDPQGAAFAVFTPKSEAPGHSGPPEPGNFSWHELATSDHQAAFDFYQQLFGWEKTDATDLGAMGVYQMYGLGGVPLGGMFNKPAEMPGPPAWLYYTTVDNVNQAVERVKKHGGQVLNGPMEVPGGDIVAQCMDPQGAPFAIHSSKSGG